jgi:hypothetical protein
MIIMKKIKEILIRRWEMLQWDESPYLAAILLICHYTDNFWQEPILGGEQEASATAVVVGVAALTGAIIKARARRKERKRLEAQRKTIPGRIEQIKKYLPQLEISTEMYDAIAAMSADEYEKASNTQPSQQMMEKLNVQIPTAGYGRAPGEENMRDENRQSTADTVARGKGASGSSSDLLGLLGAASAQERKGSRNIDVHAAEINQKERARDEGLRANEREGILTRNRAREQDFQQNKQFHFSQMNNSLLTQADAHANKASAEFQHNEFNPYLQAMADKRGLEANLSNARMAESDAWANTFSTLASSVAGVGGAVNAGSSSMLTQQTAQQAPAMKRVQPWTPKTLPGVTN